MSSTVYPVAHETSPQFTEVSLNDPAHVGSNHPTLVHQLTDSMHSSAKKLSKGWNILGKKLHLIHDPNKSKHGEKKETNKFMIKVIVSLFLLCAFICVLWFYYYPHHFTNTNPDGSFIDGFYYYTTTMSTVGYGDITPKTTNAKIFTCFMQLLTMFVSMGVVFKLTDSKLQYLLQKGKQRVANARNSSVVNSISGDSSFVNQQENDSGSDQLSIAMAALEARKKRDMEGRTDSRNVSEEGYWQNNDIADI
jgi:Ion channel